MFDQETTLAILRQEKEYYLRAFEEITKGLGAYYRNPLEHADSCIKDMKEIARKAIAGDRIEYDD